MNLPHEQTLRFRRGRQRLEARLRADGADFVVHSGDGEFRLQEAVLDADVLIARLPDAGPVRVRIIRADGDIHAVRDGAVERITLIEPDPAAFGRAVQHSGRVEAPMPGQIIAVQVAVGDRVQAQQPLAILEAMKMEHVIRAPSAGTVSALHCAVGDRVAEGAELVGIEAK